MFKACICKFVYIIDEISMELNVLDVTSRLCLLVHK